MHEHLLSRNCLFHIFDLWNLQEVVILSSLICVFLFSGKDAPLAKNSTQSYHHQEGSGTQFDIFSKTVKSK